MTTRERFTLGRRLAALQLLFLATLATGSSAAQSVKIDLAHGSDSERQTKARLAEVLASYDLSKY
jgi:hypothetical protein